MYLKYLTEFVYTLKFILFSNDTEQKSINKFSWTAIFS